jgi:hypothetical protein
VNQKKERIYYALFTIHYTFYILYALYSRYLSLALILDMLYHGDYLSSRPKSQAGPRGGGKRLRPTRREPEKQVFVAIAKSNQRMRMSQASVGAGLPPTCTYLALVDGPVCVCRAEMFCVLRRR